MSFAPEKRAAHRILSALDQGPLDATHTIANIRDADPTLIYFLFTWLRATYPPSHPASDGVLGRLGELVSRYPEAVRIAKKGASDPIVQWFEDAYSYRDFLADDFVDLIVEKLEG